jgi:hypothetical protein
MDAMREWILMTVVDHEVWAFNICHPLEGFAFLQTSFASHSKFICTFRDDVVYTHRNWSFSYKPPKFLFPSFTLHANLKSPPQQIIRIAKYTHETNDVSNFPRNRNVLKITVNWSRWGEWIIDLWKEPIAYYHLFYKLHIYVRSQYENPVNDGPGRNLRTKSI